MHSVQCIRYLLWARKKVTRQQCNHEIKKYAAAVIRWGGESLQVTCLYVYLCVDMHLFMCAHDHTLMHVISAVVGARKEKWRVKESFSEKACLI